MVTTSVNLKGPYPLTTTSIDQAVPLKSPGVYVLSRNGRTAHYVGRSDSDVRSRLKDYLGTQYSHFWFDYATSPRDAFYKECILYHQYGGSASLDNVIHPQHPANTNWRCPVCDY